MTRKLFLFLLAILGIQLASYAQPRCAFDEMHSKRLASDPSYATSVSTFDRNWAQINQNQSFPQGLVVNNSQGVLYEVPVVIHVVHTGGAVGSIYNPTDAQLISWIDYLNATYATTWASYPDSLSGGTRVPIKFVLAKRSPSCAATNGIVRVDGSSLSGYTANGVNNDSTNGVGDATMKSISRWDYNDYINIYVVNKIDSKDGTAGSFVAGYAYLASATGANVDGIVVLATQTLPGRATLPHEMGHYLNLHHTFRGGTTTVCPPNANCATDGDMICDTEPQRQSNFNCPVDPNPCTGNSYNFVQYNMMDYSSCKNRFTQGQRTRMMSALLTLRSSLFSSLGTLAPTTPTVTNAACTPTQTTPANTFDAGPEKVVFNDMTGVTAGGYNSDGNLVYIDKSCVQRANVLSGTTYNLSVTTGSRPERVRVYIDYNNDGVFGNTAPEFVYSHDGTMAYETHTGSVTIPTTGVVTCVPLRMRVVSDRVAAALTPTACGPLTTGQAEDYSVLVLGNSNQGSVAIAMTSGSNPSCIGTSLTFTATYAGISTTPTYKWYRNGTAITGATASTYTATTLVNNDVITARVFYVGPCGNDSSLSNSITVQRVTSVVPTVSIAITAGTNPGCSGQSVTFTPTPTAGGTTPTYIWQTSFNGITWTTAAAGSTFTTTSLACASYIRAIMTSSLSCASPTTATSNVITYTCSAVTGTATIALVSGTNPMCKDASATFTAAVTSAGPNPTYSWLVNGVAIGNNTLTYTTNTLNNGDRVSLLYNADNICIKQPIYSNDIFVQVIPLDTPSVYVAITKGSNPGCEDSVLEFTATASSSIGLNGYKWYLNGVNVATGSTIYSSPGFQDGDKVCVNITAGPGCHITNSYTSDTIVVRRYATPQVPFISFIGNMLVSDVPNVQWYGPNGLIVGATSSSYHATEPGDYYAVAISNGCPSLPSNVLQVSLLTVGSYDLSQVYIYPNPTTGVISFDWGSKFVTAKISIYTPTGQMARNEFVANANKKSIDISGLASGLYFAVIKDDKGNTGTVKITLAK